MENKEQGKWGKESTGISPAQILKIGEESWRLPLKAEHHLIPVSYGGAELFRT